MKKIFVLFITLMLLILPVSCKKEVEFTEFPSYEFSTTVLKTKEYDEVTITYPAYMNVIMDTEELSYDGEGDWELEYYDKVKDEYAWLSLLTVKLEEDVKASDVTDIELKHLVSDFEEPVKMISMEYMTVDGKEMFLARFDMVDEYYDQFGTEYWMVGIYDYETSSLFSFNVQADAGMCIDDCLAILSNLDFR